MFLLKLSANKSFVVPNRPRPLDLSASDRLMALENLEVLQSNGFDVVLEKDEDAMEEDENEGGVQGRLMLVSQPVSKSTVFDMSGTLLSKNVILKRPLHH
jgi:hypothetical protein